MNGAPQVGFWSSQNALPSLWIEVDPAKPVSYLACGDAVLRSTPMSSLLVSISRPWVVSPDNPFEIAISANAATHWRRRLTMPYGINSHE
jgi:hypothetical protein